jgi:RNA polymerase sigma-70 factor (ECF subfamily)
VNFPVVCGEVVGVDRLRTDAEVIATSLQDREAFGEIFDRHFDVICRYLARRVGADLAGDIASSVFLAALEQRGRYKLERADALPWLYGIAANKIRRHRRSEERRLRAVAGIGVANEPAVGGSTTIDRAVASALVSLATRDREVVFLSAWADLSYEEIADALDIPVGTVRSRLNRARRALRAHLDPAPGSQPSDEEVPQWTS